VRLAERVVVSSSAQCTSETKYGMYAACFDTLHMIHESHSTYVRMDDMLGVLDAAIRIGNKCL
jgi:hypothetical protein